METGGRNLWSCSPSKQDACQTALYFWDVARSAEFVRREAVGEEIQVYQYY